MRRFILTGAPGAGKTTLLRHLENRGYPVVEEAATDIIGLERKNGVQKPWEEPSFIEKVLALQRRRQTPTLSSSEVQFFDRAPLDTLALCHYAHLPVSAALLKNIGDAQEAGEYERDVFFIENLGFCEPSEARKITFEESLRFEKIHEAVYTEWGYHCLKIPRQSATERMLTLLTWLKREA